MHFSGPQKSTVMRMFEFQDDLKLLEAFLLGDLIKASDEGKFHSNIDVIKETFYEKYNFLVKKHHLSKYADRYKKQATQTLASNVYLTCLSTETEQLEYSNYDKWMKNQKDGKYHFGYYTRYALDSLTGQGQAASSRPDLMMDMLEEQLEYKNIDESQHKESRRPKR